MSCVELRTGVVDADDELTFDTPGPTTTVPTRDATAHSRADLRRQNDELAG